MLRFVTRKSKRETQMKESARHGLRRFLFAAIVMNQGNVLSKLQLNQHMYLNKVNKIY